MTGKMFKTSMNSSLVWSHTLESKVCKTIIVNRYTQKSVNVDTI